MFIVWGKKLVYRKLGHVADFCPICRKPRAFVLRRLGSAGHLYYVSVGQGELVGYERTCARCGVAFNAEPAHYAAVARKPAPLRELARQTFPHLEVAWRERLDLERQLRQNPRALSADDRKALIRSPFLLLSPQVEKRFAATHFDKEVGFAALGALALMFGVPLAIEQITPQWGGLPLLVGMALGFLLVAVQIALAGGRYMRRQIVPLLAQCLRPLQPTQGELQVVMAELKTLRHKMASKLKLPVLMAQISHLPQIPQGAGQGADSGRGA